MRHILFALFAIIATATYSQDFAPVGAKWYYTVKWAWSWQGEQTYMTIDATKDTIIDSINCTELSASTSFCGGYEPMITWVYSSDSIVYFKNQIFDHFQILYNFKAKTNDSWKIDYPTDMSNIDSLIVSVDSATIETINSTPLKVLYVKYTSLTDSNFNYHSKIVEKIGDFSYLFNLNNDLTICDATWSDGLRCYEDSVFGFYSTGVTSTCDYVYVLGLNDVNINEEIVTLFPNPATNYLTIETPQQTTIEISNIQGQIIKTLETKENKTNVDVSGFARGVYIINVETDKGVWRGKFVKE